MKNSIKKPLVSIVVPVYNVEQYLSACINSILGQLYANIELVLVDDGSTDNSGEICDKFASEDSRVVVIHQKNGGISNARNAGLEIIKGEWVLFVDSDDWIEKDCISQLLSNASIDTDAIACGSKIVSLNTGKPNSACQNKEYIGKDVIREAYSAGELKGIFYGPHGKLYNCNIAKSIRFDERLAVAEDIVFNVDFLCKSNAIVTIDYFGYNIRNNADSTTHKINSKFSPMFEHSYTLIADAIFEARKKLGIPESELMAARQKGYAQRYFEEVSNLFKNGTPYNKKEIFQKINIINKDSRFINEIKKRKISSLSTSEKIACISAKIGINFVTYYMFLFLLKISKKL